ncbi:MAG: hypothetical protein RI568_12275 [Natronomonas sp.]|nr:hypothetical protein [Natronomonas sp.]MDR9431458.1 hypothetical protein [Natronomonas sp.]
MRLRPHGEDPDTCPMADLGDQVGVSPESGEVAGPVDAPESGR